MSEEKSITPEQKEEEGNEPIYYKPGHLSLISTLSTWISWITLVIFIANTLIQVVSLQNQIANQGLLMSQLYTDPNFQSYLFSNLLLPFFTGLVFFPVLQGVAIGLNVLLELDFNSRD